MPGIAALLLRSALAQPAPPPLAGGDPTDGWPAVVGLYAYSNLSGGDAFCSGTLITPDAVLTCGHCVDRLREHEDGGTPVYVIFGTDVWEGNESFAQVIDAEVHPDWNGEFDRDIGADFAVLRLDAPATDVEPIPVNTEPVDDSWIGVTLDYVGWGATTDDLEGGGVKRHAQMSVLDWGEWWIQHDDHAEGQNTCYGDSGGAVLRTFPDGTERLVAIPALIYPGESDYCTTGGGYDFRVDQRLDFIEGALAAWAEPADTGEPEVAAEPGKGGRGCAASPGNSAWAAALAALASLCRRRFPSPL